MKNFHFLKILLTLMAVLNLSLGSYSQLPLNNLSTNRIIIAIPDHSIISSWDPATGKPTFTIAAINSLFSGYGVNKCEKAFPESRYPHMQKVYQITCNDTNLVHVLHNNYPQYFPKGHVEQLPVASYTPNDWSLGYANHTYLEYIRARQAWEITKGNPDVIIGINDTYINTSHPDLQFKIAHLGDNTYTGSDAYHGTAVSGFAAAGTDNNTGISAIGFNCRIDFNLWGLNNILKQSRRNRPIINASWLIGTSNILDLSDPLRASQNAVFSEIYENGTFMCVAAGNGNGQPWQYTFPASYDHVFSTTHIGWYHTYGSGPGTVNVADVYQRIIGDTITKCHNRNPRVDLMAPAHRLGGLTQDLSNPSVLYTYEGHAGTSFASPMVAGTAGLMKSVNACLTPYQLEYLLKQSAKSSVLSLPENLPFAGRIGAGALNAENAVKMAKPVGTYNPCNDPVSATMFIKGVELTSICKPGSSSNGHKPKLKPVIENGVPPYTYRWDPVNDGSSDGNQTTLDAYNIAEPTIISSFGGHKAVYRVWVYDNSPVQKVASKYVEIQLTDEATYDLASRDSYMDMLDEANTQAIIDPREWQIWESPDLWVRRQDDNGTVPQHPEYFTSNPNYVYVRIRNVGCQPAPSGAGNVKVYWTKASTGENWKYDWDGTTHVGASSGGVIPAGGMLPSGPKPTPALQPGQSAILKFPWYPTRPQDFYGSPTSVDVCLLSRIEQSGLYFGMTIPELINTSVTPNVKNNNNIVTRNLLVTDLHAGNTIPLNRWIDIVNAEPARRTFNIELINNRTIHPQLSGDFSVIGRVRVHLGPLYDRWIQGGGQGTYTALEPNTKSIIFNGVDPLRLENVLLNAGERFNVKLEFIIDNDYALTGNSFLFHLRQISVNDPANIYGNVSVLVNTHAPQKPLNKIMQGLEMESGAQGFRVYPNPASEQVSIRSNHNSNHTRISLYDATGRIISSETFYFYKGSDKKMDIAHLAPGLYMISIEAEDGTSEKHKFVKQ